MHNSQRKTILMAEDEELILLLYKDHLEELGYETLVASDGEIAFKLLKNIKVDLVVTDFKMPNMNGKELIMKATSELENPPPFIMVTGERFSDDFIQNEALLKIIKKPIDIEYLSKFIGDYFNSELKAKT
jgi:two-component system, OmpR family, response regulator VicR